MPEIVQPDLAQACGLDQPTEDLRHIVGGSVGAVLPGDHPAAVLVTGAPLLPLEVLRQAVCEQGADRALPEVDAPVFAWTGWYWPATRDRGRTEDPAGHAGLR